MSAADGNTAKALCGRWMPRTMTTCARTRGHGGSCMTAENMARRRAYRRDHPHRESPESRRKSKRKYRITCYGLTQEQFYLLLDAQQQACGMCHEPFAQGQLIHIDHDHVCCQAYPADHIPRPVTDPVNPPGNSRNAVASTAPGRSGRPAD
jgi:Recombination endonuclease VII